MSLREFALNKNRIVIELKCSIQSECSICMEELFMKKVYHAPCGHTFHVQCLSQWRMKRNNCPLCRQILSKKDEATASSADSTWIEFAYLLSIIFPEWELVSV